MTKRYLSLGLDDERPYGALAESDKGRTFLNEKIDFLKRMNERFDAESIPRTHFLLGAYIEAARAKLGETVLRAIYNRENPLLDIQQHTYSHGVMSPLQGVNKDPLSAEDYIKDIARAGFVIKDTLGVKPVGLRTPYGYETDLSDRIDILQGLHDHGITFVSADMGPKATLEGPLTKERQPHPYVDVGYPDIVEMPGHGLQDVVFTQEKAKQLFGGHLRTPDEARAHFLGLLDQAELIHRDQVATNLILHPWAVMEYDPQLDILVDVVRAARERGFEILTYKQVADLHRA